jgi:hypothetical protein
MGVVYRMKEKKSNKLLKVIVILGLILAVILVFGLIFSEASKDKGYDVVEEENNKTQEGNQTDDGTQQKENISGGEVIFLFIIFAGIIFALIIVQKNSPGAWKLLKDKEVREKAKKILEDEYDFMFDKNQGSVVFYISYYIGGDKRFPRAVVGFSLKQRTNDGNIEPVKTDIIAIDVSRKDLAYDSELLGSMTQKEVIDYIYNRGFGKTGQSPAPMKQEKIIVTEAEQELIDEIKKDKIKEKFE